MQKGTTMQLIKASAIRALRTLLQGILGAGLVNAAVAAFVEGADTTALIASVATVLTAAVASFLQGILAGLPEVDAAESLAEAAMIYETDTANLREGNPTGDETFGPCEPNCTADCAKSCPDAGPAAEAKTPAASASKAAWVDYAAALGMDVTGLTKQQIIEALERR